MIRLKTSDEVEIMARAGAILGELYRVLPEKVSAGASTGQLDRFAEEFIRSHDGAEPAFKGLYGFPATLCTSLNAEVVHGIPSRRRILAEGDVLSVDCGVKLEGFFADAAITIPVGEVSEEAAKLLAVTEEALEAGIAEASAGQRLGDVGAAIQAVGERHGYGIVRDLVGHGVGHEPHEEPQVPNWGRKGRGMKIPVGLVIAIEPMFNAGSAGIRTLDDRWTVVTDDQGLSAHFEHTIAVTEDGPRVLTR